MIPRKYLELVILSILENEDAGMTGYAIVKEINSRLGLDISPGTIYPKLKNLTEEGYLRKDENNYQITPGGISILKDKIPGLLKKNTRFLPGFFKLLTNALPFDMSSDFWNDLPTEMFMGTYSNFQNIFDITKCGCCDNISDSIENLSQMKDRLVSLKDKYQERMKQKIQEIEEKIMEIDKKISECHEETKSWVQIPIDDGDEDDE